VLAWHVDMVLSRKHHVNVLSWCFYGVSHSDTEREIQVIANYSTEGGMGAGY
jgi:hypothetical protein